MANIIKQKPTTEVTFDCPLLPYTYTLIWWQKMTVFGFELYEEAVVLFPIPTLCTVIYT